MKLRSPITNKTNTVLKKTITSNLIIDLYKSELGIDVSRFFKNVDSVNIYECLDSRYLFYYPFNIIGDEKFYDDLKIQMPIMYNVNYYSTNKWEYDLCSKMIDVKEKVYEIGAGDGAFLVKLKNLGVGQVFGSELNENSIESARKHCVDLEFITIEEKAKEFSNEFDVVCSFQVLEHVQDVSSFLISALKILKNGGKLIISVPFNSPYLFNKDILNTLNMPPHHMGLWNKNAFKNLTNFFPLKIEDIIIQRLPSSGYDFDRHFEINKINLFRYTFPFKSYFEKVYKLIYRKYSYMFYGKNIIAIYRKR